MRLYTKKDISPDKGFDSVKQRHKDDGHAGAQLLLDRCRRAWENLRQMREARQRVMDYCYGDQWSDLIWWKGQRISEREYIRRRGDIALTNNIMISILNTIVGLYAKQQTEPVCFARVSDAQPLSDMMSATLQQNWQLTNMPDVLKTVFEDALMGGVSVVRECFERRDETLEAWTDYVNPNYVFWEAGSDPRYKDLRMVGMLHDLSRNELYKLFANKRYGWTTRQLDEVFIGRTAANDLILQDQNANFMPINERNKEHNISFEVCTDFSLVRVIEVWTKETKRRLQCYDPIATSTDDAYYRAEMADKRNIDYINAQRLDMYHKEGIPAEQVPLIQYEEFQDEYWYYSYLAPDGTILCEGETPYDFHSHPFTIKMFPYVNGEVHSFMANIIDQQRYINRLIVMHDMAARSAAKGITIIPENCIPDDMTPEDFADQFTAYDGLIIYATNRQNPNLRPEIITSNAVQIGTTELLNMEMNLVRDITNVSGALQGKTPTSGTSAQRYSMETQNSTTALYSVFADMTSFTEELARKKVEVIKQYYPDGKYILNKDMTSTLVFDKLKVGDVFFKIAVKESAASAAYQMQANDSLKELLTLGLIDVTQYLQNVNLPFADNLLQSIITQQREQAMQQQMAASPQPAPYPAPPQPPSPQAEALPQHQQMTPSP